MSEEWQHERSPWPLPLKFQQSEQPYLNKISSDQCTNMPLRSHNKTPKGEHVEQKGEAKRGLIQPGMQSGNPEFMARISLERGRI